MCMCICGCSTHNGQKRAMDHPEIGVMLPDWMLGTELKSSTRATRTVNHLSHCSNPIFPFSVMWFVYSICTSFTLESKPLFFIHGFRLPETNWWNQELTSQLNRMISFFVVVVNRKYWLPSHCCGHCS